MAYSEGSLVILRSGGPVMTVEDVRDDDLISVAWHTQGGELRREAFHPDSLVPIDQKL